MGAEIAGVRVLFAVFRFWGVRWWWPGWGCIRCGLPRPLGGLSVVKGAIGGTGGMPEVRLGAGDPARLLRLDWASRKAATEMRWEESEAVLAPRGRGIWGEERETAEELEWGGEGARTCRNDLRLKDDLEVGEGGDGGDGGKRDWEGAFRFGWDLAVVDEDDFGQWKNVLVFLEDTGGGGGGGEG